MPIVFLGSWKTSSGVVVNAVKVAINVGYHHFDCTYLDLNERGVGMRINSKSKAAEAKSGSVCHQ